MVRANVDIDDEACAEVMRRYGFTTKRQAINFALRTLAVEHLSVNEARELRGIGWEGDLDTMRSSESMTNAITIALRENLDGERRELSVEARIRNLRAIRKHCRNLLKDGPSAVERGDFLYDENGLSN